MAVVKKANAASRRKKEKKNIVEGIVHIQASFNNTVINVTDMNGNTIAWASAGSAGFKGTKKGTPYAAQMATAKAITAAQYHGIQSVHIRVSGPGSGRESTIRSLAAAGLKIRTLRDVTPIPHNGCRPRKKRRV